MSILDAPLKPPMRYLGAKFMVSKRIIATFPKHSSYMEPFFGSGAIYLGKALAPMNTLIDKDHHIVNMYSVIRNSPGEFVDAVKNTPYAHEEFDRCVTALHAGTWDSDIEHARLVYTVLHQSLFGQLTPPAQKTGKSTWKVSYGKSPMPVERASVFRKMDWHFEMISQKLRRAQIECADALDVLPNYIDGQSDTLVYCDPPYLKDARATKSAQYKHDQDDEFHRRLLEMLNDAKCAVAISGYRNPLYDEMLSGWNRLDMVTNHAVIQTKERGLNQTTDCLWTNYPVSGQQDAMFEMRAD